MSEMAPDAMDFLAASVRHLRTVLENDLSTQLERRFRLSVPADRAGLDQKRLVLRGRLETWLAERARARSTLAGLGEAEARALVRREAESGMAARTLLRLVLLRQLEARGASRPAVLSAGWLSKGYVEFRDHAPGLLDGVQEGFELLLKLVFDELAIDLPGLYREQPTDPYFALSPAVFREVISMLNADELKSAWKDDTTLGWVYQFWNDPQREAIDERIGPRGKVAPHEIASKTQLFTERYMVEWLLQNSVGRIAAAMRTRDRAGSAQDPAPVPTGPLFVNGGPRANQDGLPGRLSELRILDPACGSGHFLAGAFDLLVPLYRQEARDAGRDITPEEIADHILRHNLHGVDIDRRAVQVAAAVLYLKARKLTGTGQLAGSARIPPMNLVATSFDLDGLDENDSAFNALVEALPGRREALVEGIQALRHVSFRGSLFRFEADRDRTPALFSDQVARDQIERFIDQHARAEDLGVRFDGTQLAAGLRLRGILQEGRYDVVVFNPPYLATSKIDVPPEVLAEAFAGAPDLFAAFVDRAFELCKPTGLIAFVTLSNWMFLSSFQGVRRRMLDGSILLLADIGKGAFRRASKLIQTVMVVATPDHELEGTALAARIGSRDAITASQADDLAKALTDPTIYRPFEPALFTRIEGAPLLFWLDPGLLRRYGELRKIGDVAEGAGGIATTDNDRFLRAIHEVATATATAALKDSPSAAYVPYLKGAAGQEWIEPPRWLLRTGGSALELRVLIPNLHLARPLALGVAYTTIGQRFGARLHTVSSVRDVSGASFFPGPRISNESLVCALNRSSVRELATALNPTINFQIGDVRRLPFDPVEGAGEIVAVLRKEFLAAEQGNELSPAYTGLQANAWAAAQRWAQRAVDRPPGEPVPHSDLAADSPEPWLRLSHAVGVALGRLPRAGRRAAGAAPPETLSDGILFLAAEDASSLHCGACDELREAWEEVRAEVGGGDDLATYLRKSFFAAHKRLYHRRPIYLPLSSARRNFVAYVSIHRWHADTLQVLLAEHILPEQRRIDGQLTDLREARQERRTQGDADQRYVKMQRLSRELNEFVEQLSDIAQNGPPQPDGKTPPREADARFVMDLDDGVMVNSAALWPLLLPQWKDPMTWWKELCTAKGRKDYDWSQLAARYFPARVAEKCRKDPSLAVAHHCFWRLWPGKAYAWELRLQDEIRPDFTIDEPDSDEARRTFLAEHPGEANAILATEMKRGEREARKETESDGSDGPLFDGQCDP